MAAKDVLDVLLRFRADTRQATQSVDAATESVDKLSKSLKTAGVGLATAFGGAATKNALDFMSELTSAADRIGLTTDALQELRFVGQQAGLQVEELDDVMQSFVERLGDAQGRTGEAYEALQALGVNLEATRGGFKSTEQVLYEVSDAFANLDDAQQRVFRAQQIFESDTGVKFLNVLTQGSEAMREMRLRARELGVVIDEDMIRKSQEANRQLGTLAFILRGQFNQGVAEAAPLIAKLGEGFEFLLTNIGRTYRILTDSNEAVQRSLENTAEATFKVSAAVEAMHSNVRRSIAETQQAVADSAQEEVTSQLDAATIRLDAIRALNNRDFAGAEQHIRRFNQGIRDLAAAGREPQFVITDLLRQSEELGRMFATQAATPPPAGEQVAAVGPGGEPLRHVPIPSTEPNVGMFQGRQVRYVPGSASETVPGATTLGEFEPVPPPQRGRLPGADPALLAEQSARRRQALETQYRQEAREQIELSMTPTDVLFRTITDVIQLIREDSGGTSFAQEALAQAERQHGPLN